MMTDTLVANRTMNDGFVLQLEINENGASEYQPLMSAGVLFAPPVGEDYWLLRVKVSDNQALIAFPKFCTIGMGFAQEEDWNTNLPTDCDTDEIWDHIKHNKGDDSIPDDRCIEAIRMIQEAVEFVKSNE